METTGDRYIWAQGWQGYALPASRLPGMPVAQGQIQPSFSKQYIIRNFGLGDAVPQEDIDDDMYAVIKYVLAKKGGLMAVAFMNLLQYQTAQYFQNQGFASGSSVAGMADGVSLFNTAHPISASNLGTTVSNRPSVDADLSVTTGQFLVINLLTQKAPDNLTFLNNKLRAVVYNPALRFVAQQVFKQKWQPYSADRTEGFLDSENIELIEWPYFQKSGSTGTNNAYFGVGEDHYLRFWMRSAETTQTDYDINTNSQLVTKLIRFDLGADDWRGTAGSPGK